MADTFKNLSAMAFAAIAGEFDRIRRVVASFVSSAPSKAAPGKRVEPRRLTLADQWAYLTEIVMGAATRAEEAARCHVSATQQLDLAQYALSSMIDELSAVMDMGGRVRRRGTLHVFGVAPAQAAVVPIGRAIAA
jgi:hypothetical protein